MKPNFVDCFMLMNTALSINGGAEIPLTDASTFEPVQVNVSLDIENFVLFDSKIIEIRVTLILNQWWLDPSLDADTGTKQKAVNGKIWSPKLSITNGILQGCKSDDTSFWRGFGDQGRVLLSEKMVVNTRCSNNFYKYPFDAHLCSLDFSSYRFLEEEVMLLWDDENPSNLHKHFHLLNQFVINGITHESVKVSRESGNFSSLTTMFSIQRNGNYVLTTHILSNLITAVISYITLWIPHKVHGHSAKYILNIFSVAHSSYNISTSLAVCNSLKLLDWYALKHLAFTLISLMLTFAKHLLTHLHEEGSCLSNVQINVNSLPKIESISRVLYPVVYLAANIGFYYYLIVN